MIWRDGSAVLTVVVVADSSDPHPIAREVAVFSYIVETVEDISLGGILGKAVEDNSTPRVTWMSAILVTPVMMITRPPMIRCGTPISPRRMLIRVASADN